MRKPKKQNKTQLVQENLEVPRLLKSRLCHLEMQGNEEAMIDGCDGICDYSADGIKLRAGAFILSFQGENLVVKSFADGEAVLEGMILNISFEN